MKKTKKTNKNKELATTKKKVGRPSKYDIDYHPEKTRQLMAERGYTEKQLAKSLKVTFDTITKWKKKHSEFLLSLNEGRELFDNGTVEKTGLKRALGYDYVEKTITDGPKGIITTTHYKHMPPDPKSLWKWLEHRNRKRWGKLPENPSQQGPTVNIQILGELSIEQLKTIQEAVRTGIPAVIENSN